MKRVPIQMYIPIISDKQNCCPYEEPYGYIYKITNKINGHYYIGKHEHHYPRIDTSYKGSGEALWRAYRKYGVENFDMSVLEWSNKDNDELSKLEIYWIDIFSAYKFPFHYNLTEGGDGIPRGYSFDLTEEQHQYRSSLVSGENNSMFNKRFYGEDNPNFNNKWDFEKRKRQSQIMTGRFVGENNPMFGLYGKDNPNSGKVRTEEFKSYLSKIHSGSGNPMFNTKSPNRKPVKQLDKITGDLIRIYDCIDDVKLYGFNPVKVGDCCRGLKYCKTHKGYVWKYL